MTNQPEKTESPRLVSGELRLIGGLTARLFGLLAAIDETGSISKAARATGLSYKGAWDILERANNLSPQVLIATEIGGRHGGGAQLTPVGQKLLALFLRIQERHRRFLDELNDEVQEDSELRILFRRLVVRASARNQVFGQVEAILETADGVDASLRIKGGARLVASITRASAEALGVKPLREVIALIKAPEIMIVTDLEGYRLAMLNQLEGTVERIQMGAVNCEAVVCLSGGDSIAATLTKESLARMNLQVGDPATAVFSSASVVLGAAENPA